MDEAQKTEFVARCAPIPTQRATNSQNSATKDATITATKSLKALAGAVLGRNEQRNVSATKAEKQRNELPLKTPLFVAFDSLSISDEKAIRGWLAHIGEKDAEIIGEVLEKCSHDPEALAYFLGRAKEVPTQKPTQVKCVDCQHWRSFYSHGKATGLCDAGVKPSGVVHWFETPRACGSFNAKASE